MQKITPFLWFDSQAEEAVSFYTSLFQHSQQVAVTRYGEGGPRPAGSVMTVAFQLAGQDFVALNGGPEFPFTHAISFVVNCETQAEVDHFSEKLGDGGAAEPCGWVRDKYGVSWQVVPTILNAYLLDKDPAKVERVMNAMLQMIKIDIAALNKAYTGT
jgi:predicted 3-demethylubiquinone-9 3-methyltransferase (glyoxalase superfamily)